MKLAFPLLILLFVLLARGSVNAQSNDSLFQYLSANERPINSPFHNDRLSLYRPAAGSLWMGNPERTDPTWRAMLLCMVVMGLGLYGLHRWRINQLLQVQTVRRDRIARDLHDDIGSTLSNINMLSAITLNKMEFPEEAVHHLRRISEEVSYCSQALDDIIWSANSKNDTLDEAIARMRRYYAELFELSGKIEGHLDMDEQFATRKLCMEQRRDIYLIYKEALNNIYKHAGASAAWIRVGVKGNSMELVFKDNGKGFDVSKLSHRNGLKNMRARVAKWEGRMNIQSGSQDGTLVQIVMPIDHPNG